MNRKEYLLTCLAEECNEVAQRVSKALRFGLAEVQDGQPLSNKERIETEFLDLMTVLGICFQEGILEEWSEDATDLHAQEKGYKIEKYYQYAKKACGTITSDPRPLVESAQRAIDSLGEVVKLVNAHAVVSNEFVPQINDAGLLAAKSMEDFTAARAAYQWDFPAVAKAEGGG